MKQQRLDGLADGIFAIVMTLLVLELKVPMFAGVYPTDEVLIHSLVGIWKPFMSLILSFALLFTYWRAHHFIASIYAKNLTATLANINAIFFFFITLVPFVAHFLGEYPRSQIAVTLYGLMVIAIGLSLFYMRIYIEKSPSVETSVITKADRRSGYIRILFPVFSAAIAIIISYWSTTVSMVIFTAAIIFNLLPASSNRIHTWLDIVFRDDDEVINPNYKSPMSDLMNNEEFICVPKSAVFDHHRFKEADTEARAVLALSMKNSMNVSTKSRATAKKVLKEVKEISKLDKEIKKELNEEIKDGTLEDVIVKKEV